jgi:hypothetical protein
MGGASPRPTAGRTARFYTAAPDYAETMAAAVPVFVRPPLHGHLTMAISRLTAHPLLGIRTRRLSGGVAAALALQLWRETADYFGYDSVSVDGGPLVPLLPPPGPRPNSVAGNPEVTGVVIAQNEAALIGRTLESLLPWVSRLLVVDGGSTDGTVDVARRQGADVIVVPFRGDFAAQRNAGLEHVSTPWALMLDCDEEIPAGLGQTLSGCVRGSDVDAVYIPRLNLVGDDPRPTRFPDLQPRLVRRWLRYQGRVHETVRPRTALYLPLNGPQLKHHKSPLRHYRNSLQYNLLNPGESTPRNLAWMREEVARLERTGPGVGDPARPEG